MNCLRVVVLGDFTVFAGLERNLCRGLWITVVVRHYQQDVCVWPAAIWGPVPPARPKISVTMPTNQTSPVRHRPSTRRGPRQHADATHSDPNDDHDCVGNASDANIGKLNDGQHKARGVLAQVFSVHRIGNHSSEVPP